MEKIITKSISYRVKQHPKIFLKFDFWDFESIYVSLFPIHKKFNKIQQFIKLCISAYLYEAQRASGNTPPIIRNLNCTSSLWFCIRERLLDVWLLDVVRVQQPHIQQPYTHAKPEAASAVLDSWWWAVCCPKHVELHINMD
jgi:hypothetical protein